MSRTESHVSGENPNPLRVLRVSVRDGCGRSVLKLDLRKPQRRTHRYGLHEDYLLIVTVVVWASVKPAVSVTVSVTL